MLEAVEIIKDEWRPPEHSLRQLVHALQSESVAHFWDKAIRGSYGWIVWRGIWRCGSEPPRMVVHLRRQISHAALMMLSRAAPPCWR
jgi:hypothetical protein